MPTGGQRCVKPARVFDTSICNTDYKTKAKRLNDLPQAQTGVGAGAWAWVQFHTSAAQVSATPAAPGLLPCFYGMGVLSTFLIAVTKFLMWRNSRKEELLGFSVLRGTLHSLAAQGPRPQQVRETGEELWMRLATTVDTWTHTETLSGGQRLALHFIFSLGPSSCSIPSLPCFYRVAFLFLPLLTCFPPIFSWWFVFFLPLPWCFSQSHWDHQLHIFLRSPQAGKHFCLC